MFLQRDHQGTKPYRAEQFCEVLKWNVVLMLEQAVHQVETYVKAVIAATRRLCTFYEH